MIGFINRQIAATRNVARTLWLDDVRLNLSERTRLLSCAVVTDQYSFRSPKAMSFRYLYGVESGELIIRLVSRKEL